VRFILAMARREMRSSWRRLLFFFISIGIGVAAIVAVRSMIENVNLGVAGLAKRLITADLQLETNRSWTPQELADIQGISAPLIESRMETVESTTMLRPADSDIPGIMIVDLKGVEPGFPFYGDLTLDNGKPFDSDLLKDNGIIVAPILIDQLKLQIGDKVNIGKETFQIRGVISRESGAGEGFRLGARVFINKAAVEQTGLTGTGSRVNRKILFKVADNKLDALVSQLKSKLKDDSTVRIRSYRDSEENLADQLSQTENYMSLLGLIILVLGGIGISNVTRVFIEQKKKAIAVLKCVGATSRKITAVYLLQVMLLGLAGSTLGVVLARGILYMLAKYLAAILPKDVSYGLRLASTAQGVLIGLLITILFSLLPLLRVRRIRANTLFRDEAGPAGSRFDPTRLAAGTAVVLGLVFVASWQAGSLKVGLYFLSGLALTALILFGAAWLLIGVVRRFKNAGTFAVRHAINSLYRPGNQTRVIVMVVGLGAFLVIAVWSLQSTLLGEINARRNGPLPNMFLIDIQKDQKEAVIGMIKQETGQDPQLVPVIQARIAAIDGHDIDLNQPEMKHDRGRLGRQYILTYRPRLESNERVIDGKFWDDTPSSDPEVSISEDLVGMAGLDVGGTITFDILGKKITARVTSVRHIDLRNSRTAFAVVFRPGAVESAPQMFVAAIDGPKDDFERSKFQRALVDQFPNLSVVDVAEAVATIKRVLDNIALAVSFLGALVFVSGALILIGSVAMTKFQRIYEIAVMKTLGAKRKTLAAMMLAEYGVMGLVAGIIGSLAGLGLSFVIARRVLHIPWSFSPEVGSIGTIVTAAAVMIIGAAASYDALNHKPLAILRGE
jgi:putative ABC transport system permease protein